MSTYLQTKILRWLKHLCLYDKQYYKNNNIHTINKIMLLIIFQSAEESIVEPILVLVIDMSQHNISNCFSFPKLAQTYIVSLLQSPQGSFEVTGRVPVWGLRGSVALCYKHIPSPTSSACDLFLCLWYLRRPPFPQAMEQVQCCALYISTICGLRLWYLQLWKLSWILLWLRITLIF